MTVILGFDTATTDTVVAVVRDDADPIELRHTPAPGERPQHAQQLLPMAREALERAGLRFIDVQRIGVGVGPGTFTGLRIGVATARALAQSSGAELAAVSTLDALAAGVVEHDSPVLAVLDARRGEAFVAAYDAARMRLAGPAAVAPQDLPAWADRARGTWLAVGDGAVRFAEQLGPADVQVPPQASPLHRVSAIALCRLAREADPVDRDTLIPEYVRAPDAELRDRP
jgi:tRNA threonylcarbamoyladenosine biosynthesis protein TsaB